MAVNWVDPNEVQLFKDTAVKQGVNPDEVDQYVNEKVATPNVLNTPIDQTQNEAPQDSGFAILPSPFTQIPSLMGKQLQQPGLQPIETTQPSQTPFSQPVPSKALSQPKTSDVVPSVQTSQVQSQPQIQGQQNGILGTQEPITMRFGVRSPIEKYTGGVHYGTDFGTPRGTPLAVPQGNWKVVQAYGAAKEGNRGANSGMGNMIKLQNTDTGEVLNFQHLSKVNAQPGQVLQGGTVVANTGNTGNSTGPHLHLQYQDAQGRYKDITKSPYRIFGGS